MNEALTDSITSNNNFLASIKEEKKHTTHIIGAKKHQRLKRNLIRIKVRTMV